MAARGAMCGSVLDEWMRLLSELLVTELLVTEGLSAINPGERLRGKRLRCDRLCSVASGPGGN